MWQKTETLIVWAELTIRQDWTDRQMDIPTTRLNRPWVDSVKINSVTMRNRIKYYMDKTCIYEFLEATAFWISLYHDWQIVYRKCYSSLFPLFLNRPVVAGAVLQSPPSLTDWFNHSSFSPNTFQTLSIPNRKS